MERTDWERLPNPVRSEITRHTGPVRSARTVPAGKNSAVAAILETNNGAVFVKGLPLSYPAQLREAAINPYVQHVSPPLLWHAEVDGWRLLGFDHARGRHADYGPGSGDLPKVITAMRQLGQLPCPDLPQLKRAEQRWAEHVDSEADLALLRGDTLLHTDYAPDNVLIDDGHARLIDWAWPTRGAPFIDPACLVVRLIFAGHTSDQAELQVASLPAWRTAPVHAVDAFAAALARMWSQIADLDPAEWKRQMADAARSWRDHRNS